MNLLAALHGFFLRDSAALKAQRSQILARMSLVVLALLLPFLAGNLWEQRFALAALDLLLIVALAAWALAVRSGRAAPLRFDLLLLPVLVGVGLAMATQGLNGALWAYPALLFCHFSVSRRLALLAALLLLAGTSLFVGAQVGPELGWRVFASMLLLWLMACTALQVLADSQEELLRLAGTDPLTGALNRRRLDQALGELVNRARRRPIPASIVLIDIDNFKQINDGFGHAAGDAVLVGLVKLVDERKRTADSLYRIGGEEFLLLAPDTVGQDASALAELLRTMVEKSELVDGLKVKVSIGVSECRTDQSPQEWLEFADKALYRAKEGGRNRVEMSAFSDSAFIAR